MDVLDPDAFPSVRRPSDLPRATLVAGRSEGLLGELWVGGVSAAHGTPLRAAQLRNAMLVDCAGEVPPLLHEVAARVVPFVFPDLESIPQRYARLLALAAELADVLRGGRGIACDVRPRNGRPERRLYVLCQQGLNRSALVAGLTLRATGMSGAEVLALLRQRRPGCLTNQTYAALVGGEPAVCDAGTW